MERIASCIMFSKTEPDICHIIYDTANAIAVISPKRSSAASYLHVGAQECAHSPTVVKRSNLLFLLMEWSVWIVSPQAALHLSCSRGLYSFQKCERNSCLQGSSIYFGYILVSERLRVFGFGAKLQDTAKMNYDLNRWTSSDFFWSLEHTHPITQHLS